MSSKFTEFNINEYIEREKELNTKKKTNRLAKISDFSKNIANKIRFDDFQKRSVDNRSKLSLASAKKLRDREEAARENSKLDLCASDNGEENEEESGDEDKFNFDANWCDSNATKNQPAVSVDSFVLVDNLLRVPKTIWNRLFAYQQDGIKWLWNLHKEKTGGLLGDEMGLGKTVQIVAFLSSLHATETREFGNTYVGLGPALVLCPSTVLHQWVDHFNEWSLQSLKVTVFHGCFNHFKSNYKRRSLIKEYNETNGILVTTYNSFLSYSKLFEQFQYHYLILDEGHKIKNPQAKITLAVKQLKCEHKIVLTASPIQNNLKELWSLFDFIAPKKLSTTLQEFTETIEQPIVQSEYKNASVHEEAIGRHKTLTLKSLIDKHILRRSVESAKTILPEKNEQILFCDLTDEQKDLYEGFLMSEHVQKLLGNTNMYTTKFNSNILTAITILRKICNHPCLYLEEAYADDDAFDIENFANFKRSGKMILLNELLEKWHRKDRVLLFTQSRKMIDFLEYYLITKNYKYLKMDGTTAITSRKNLIRSFNKDKSFFVFLLTTRVGGLGINLTGANKVLIFDPDWNPAVDLQAKERACRIGQEKTVEIFRLISKGTIEEKIYQRQIWKQLISNKVLLNTKSEKIFKKSDLFDLFHLSEKISDTTKVLVTNLEKSNLKRKRSEENFELSSDQVEEMKKLAKKLSTKLMESRN